MAQSKPDMNDNKVTESMTQSGISASENIGILVVYLSVLLMAAMADIITPFYPKEANERGLVASQYGFIVGVFDLLTLLSSIPVGKMACKYSPRSLFICGLSLLMISSLVFATLTFVENSALFFVISILCRILQGLTKSLINGTMLAFFPVLFPLRAAYYTSCGEFMYGVGEVLGPCVGGPLYHVGGFSVPFLVIGVCCLLLLPLAWLYLPNEFPQRSAESKDEKLLWKIVKIPALWICFTSASVTPAYTNLLVTTFEPSIRHLNLSPGIVGLTFSLLNITYSVGTILSGKLCDKGIDPIYFLFSGAVTGAIGNFLMSLSMSLHEIVLALVVIGIGQAAIYLPSLAYMRNACLATGLPNDIATHGLLSGFFMAFSSLGGFVGPAGGGFVFDSLGFQTMNLIFALINSVSAILLFFLYFKDICELKAVG